MRRMRKRSKAGDAEGCQSGKSTLCIVHSILGIWQERGLDEISTKCFNVRSC